MNSIKYLVPLSFLFFHISGYCWTNKEGINSTSFSTDSIKKVNLGIRYTFNYNIKVIRHSAAFNINFKHHDVYAGMEFSNILQPIWDPVDIYEKNAPGMNIGYRYLFNQKKKILFFMQLNFSVYQIKYTEASLGPDKIERKPLIIENTGTLGLNYNFFNKFYLHSGVGIGSFDGFFLMIESIFPCGYIGVGYKF